MVKLPVRFNPSRLLGDDTVYVAEVPVGHFSRFVEALSSREGTVRAEMQFICDEDKHIAVTGHFRVLCELQCQRCMKGFEHPLDAAFNLTFVVDEAAAELLAEELDPVILDEHGQIHTVDMLEDELILQLPVSPRHDDIRTCIDLGYAGALTEGGGLLISEDSDEKPERTNPFAILKKFTKTD